MSQPLERIPVFDHSDRPNISRMPGCIRQRLGGDQAYGSTARAVHRHTLHTVCEEARCPNRAECWSAGTATFMLLGDTCTRACGFCAVKTGRPQRLDRAEPERIAEAVAGMGLRYIVLTSVNRDDLADGGAGIFAATLHGLRQHDPDMGLEILTPDFQQCQTEAIAVIREAMAGHPLVWGHNVETIPRLYGEVRKGSKYRRSLELLALAARCPATQAKSALMLGLGETQDEVTGVLEDLRHAGVTRLSLGQYLRPSRFHLPVREYVAPQRFEAYAALAKSMGFTWVKSGPLVRSSYHAEDGYSPHKDAQHA